jgi:cell wall assembly regulator SMI1
LLVEHPNEFGPVDRGGLRAFEVQIGAMLPEDYRAFLIAYNGGTVSPTSFRISEAEGDSTLARFHGLHDGPTWARLDAAVAAYRGRIPAWLLPIAADEGGNAICIGLTGEDRGRIYFWDHEREGASPDIAVTHIAPSFKAFCDHLFDFGTDAPVS